jgi:hypothetical protein
MERLSGLASSAHDHRPASMTFLAPALLALGLAVAVPLALHLLQRHQGPRVVFPALRYLRRAEREHATRLRLRQILLLALRILALLLLAAAAAQPFLPTGGREHHPTAVVIVLDNSLSSGAVVGDRRILDHLKDAALATLAAAGPDDRVWLMRAGEPWEPALAGTPAAVAEAVRATEPAGTAVDLVAQLERAVSVLAAGGDERATEIHLLSDLQATSFRPGAASAGGPRVLVLEPPAAFERNRVVTAVEVGGGLPPLAGEASTVTVAVGGSAAADSEPVDVRLVVDGQVRSAGQVPVGAVATLTLPARATGLVTGRVEIDPDALAADDRRYFVTEVRRPPVVRLASPAPFLQEALAVLEEAGRTMRWTGGSDQVVIAPGAAGADAIQRGASVIVLPPASPVELGAANQRLSAAGIPWRLGPPGEGEARLETEGTGLETVLADVRLRRTHALEPAGEPPDTVLLRLRTGEAWALAGRTETGRYVLLGTPLTPEGGTIPVSVAMLPLLDRALNAWAVGGTPHREHQPGSLITLPAGDSIVRPDGRADPVLAGSAYRLTRLGIYRVLAGDTAIAAFAVNPPAAASDLRRIRTRDVAVLLPGHDIRTATARDWAGSIYHRRLGRDIVVPLLLTAALVLLIEAGMAASGRAARRRPGSAGAMADTAVRGAGSTG